MSACLIPQTRSYTRAAFPINANGRWLNIDSGTASGSSPALVFSSSPPLPSHAARAREHLSFTTSISSRRLPSCPPEEAREVRVELHRDQTNETAIRAFQFSVFARANGAEWIEHATAHSCRALVSQLDREIIASRCCKRTIVFDEKHRTRQESQLEFGPRWRSLRCLHVGNGEGLAEIDLGGKLSTDVDKFRQHPALLDMATGVALYLTDDYDNCNNLFLPIGYRKMQIYSPLPAILYSHIRVRHDGAKAGAVETFDATLFDVRNNVLAEIEGFAMRRIRNVWPRYSKM